MNVSVVGAQAFAAIERHAASLDHRHLAGQSAL